MFERRILCHAAAVHFTSQAEWDEAKPLGISLRGVVIPLGAQKEDRSDGRSLLEDYQLLPDHQVVLYLSRLDPKKNLESFLQAFAEVRAQQHDAVLVIAGEGRPDYARSLKQLVQTLGLEPHVIWLGHVGGSQKAAVLAAAQIFVLPSLSENFGLAAVEAMLAGVPCVLGQGVAIAAEALRAGACITVTQEPDLCVLVELLSDEPRRTAMGVRAREFAEQEYSLHAMAGRLTALYRRIGRDPARVIA